MPCGDLEQLRWLFRLRRAKGSHPPLFLPRIFADERRSGQRPLPQRNANEEGHDSFSVST
jgi:hypothetical protein